MLFYQFARAIRLITRKPVYTVISVLTCMIWCVAFTVLSCGYEEAYGFYRLFSDESGTGDLICTVKNKDEVPDERLGALDGVAGVEDVYVYETNILTVKGDTISARFWGCDEKELYKSVTVNEAPNPETTMPRAGVSYHHESRYHAFLGAVISIKDSGMPVYIGRVSAMPVFMSVYVNDTVRCSDESFCDFILDMESFKALFGECDYEARLAVELDEGVDGKAFAEYLKGLFVWIGDITFVSELPVIKNASELLELTRKISVCFFWVFSGVLSLAMFTTGRSISEEDGDNSRALLSMGFSRKHLLGGHMLHHIMCALSGAALGFLPAGMLKNLVANEVLFNLGIPFRVSSPPVTGYLKAVACLLALAALTTLVAQKRHAGPERHSGGNKPALSGSLFCVAISSALVLVSFCYNSSVTSMVRNLFDDRYLYDIQIFYDGFQTNKQIDDSLSSFELPLVEPSARYPVTLRHKGRSKDCSVGAIPTESALTRVYDEEGLSLAPQENQIILCNDTSVRLGAEAGDVVEYEISYDSYSVTGSCMVRSVSEQYSDFTEYIALETIAGYLQSSGVANAASIKTNEPARVKSELNSVEGVKYIYSKAQQEAAFEREFEGVRGLSYLIMIIGLTVSLMMVVLISQNYYRAKRNDFLILRAMGFSVGQLARMAFGQIFMRYAVGLVLGMIVGAVFSSMLLRDLSSSSLHYPVNVGWKIAMISLGVCCAPTIAGYCRLKRYLERQDLGELLKCKL